MGIFKKFIGGIAEETIMLEPQATGQFKTFDVPSYKDINGTTYTQITRFANSSANYTSAIPWSGLRPVATGDELSNYNVLDYQVVPVGTTSSTSQKLLTSTGGTRTFALTINNGTESAITVKCVKFEKLVYYNSSSTSNNATILCCAYYLDQSEWLTIPAGETGALAVVLKVGV